MWHTISGQGKPRPIALGLLCACTLVYIAGRLVDTLMAATTGRDGKRIVLVSARPRGGPQFLILGGSYRSRGLSYLELEAQVERSGVQAGAGAGGSSYRMDSQSPIGMLMRTGCTGNDEFVIVFGLLRDPRDEVIARFGDRSRVLTRIDLPRDLNRHEALVYTLLRQAPSEIIARDRSGIVVARENYGGLAVEHCPGAAGSTIGEVGS